MTFLHYPLLNKIVQANVVLRFYFYFHACITWKLLILKICFITWQSDLIGQSSTNTQRSNTWRYLNIFVENAYLIQNKRKWCSPVLQVPCWWYSVLWSITVCYLKQWWEIPLFMTLSKTKIMLYVNYLPSLKEHFPVNWQNSLVGVLLTKTNVYLF